MKQTIRINQLTVRATGVPQASAVAARLADQIARRTGAPLPLGAQRVLAGRIATALRGARNK